MAINENMQKYLFLGKSDLDQCTKYDFDKLLCNSNLVLYNFNVKNCIISIRHGETKPDNCNIQVFKLAQEVWFSLMETNAWLYVVPKLTRIRVSCENDTHLVDLSGSGILRLERGCSAYTNLVILTSQVTINKVQTYTYDFENLLPNISLVEFKELQLDTLKLTQMESFQLDKYSVSLKDLKPIQMLPIYDPTFNSTNISIISILLLIIFMIILIIMYKKYIKIKCFRNTFPTMRDESSS